MNQTAEININPCFGWYVAESAWSSFPIKVEGEVLSSDGTLKALVAEKEKILPVGATAFKVTKIKTSKAEIKRRLTKYQQPENIISGVKGKTIQVEAGPSGGLLGAIWL
jgi:hypothetical protein